MSNFSMLLFWFKKIAILTKRFKFLLIAILSLAYIIINLFTLCKFPSVWRDDGFISEPAWQFLKNGTFGTNLFDGIYPCYKSDIVYGRIHLLSIALLFKLFGCDPYFARLVSFLCGITAAFFIFLIGKKLFDNKTGSIAAILFLFSKQFLINSHLPRQEMMLTLFIVITIYVYILAKDKGSSLLFFLCGLIASLCIDVHLNGVIVPVAIGVLFLFTYKIQVFRKFGFWFFIFGVLFGVAYWLLVHVFPSVHFFEYFFDWKYINKDSFSTNFPLIPILSGNLFQCIIAEAGRYINYIRYIWSGEQYLNIFEAILIIIALIFNFRNKNKSILSIIVFTLMSLLCLLVVHKSIFYLIYLYPFFVLSIASFSCYFQRSKNIFKKFVIGSVSSILLISYICQDSYRLWEFKDNNYYKYLNNLKRFITPWCAIIGPSTWWYGFYEQRYYAILALDFHYLDIYTNRIDFIRQKQIKYILIDEYLGKRLPPEMENFLRANCILIATLKDKFYGAESFIPNYSSFYALKIYKVKDRWYSEINYNLSL